MIKVNLLNSVTERQGGAVVAVDRKISSPASRLLLMSIAVAFLLLAVIGLDVATSQISKNRVEAQLAEQKRIEQELATVLKEQKEAERIEARNAAKKARDFALADSIRQDLAAQGVVLQDSPQGTTWMKA